MYRISGNTYLQRKKEYLLQKVEGDKLDGRTLMPIITKKELDILESDNEINIKQLIVKKVSIIRYKDLVKTLWTVYVVVRNYCKIFWIKN